MDAFAVSICKGLSMKKLDGKKMLIIRIVFWLFSGYYAGYRLSIREGI